MFRITRDPSSGSSIQCMAKITEMVFFVSVDMVVMLFFGILILNQTPNLTNYSKYAAITPTTSISTDTIEPLL